MKFQGNFPVIKLTFEEMIPTDKKAYINKFAEMLRPAFESHSYVLKSKKDKLLKGEYMLMDKYINGNKIAINDISDSIKDLINILYMHYGRRVVLLIDEYDQTLNSLIINKSEYYQDAIELFRFLLNPIKNNEKLLLTVFTGATRLIKEGIFSGLNHFYHDSVDHSAFSEFFGFTEAEVDFLLKNLVDLNPGLSEKEVKDSVAKQYNGYIIGNKIIYNPFSIISCIYALHNKIANPYKPYWINSSSNDLITKTVLEVPTTNKIEKLIIYGQTEFAHKDTFLLEEVGKNEISLLALLLYSGYITQIKGNVYKIPNSEVKSYFFNKVLPYLLDKKYSNKETDLLLAAFENVFEYGKTFQEEIIDKSNHLNYYEFFFQTMIIVPFIKLNSKGVKHKIHIEQQTDEGKNIYVLFTPLPISMINFEAPISNSITPLSNSVYILELKRTIIPESKNILIKETLIQVFSKNYISHVLENAELPENDHWNSFHIRAIVFSPNKKMDKWFITIKELKFSLEKLKIAYKIYEDNKDKKEEMIDLLLQSAISVSEYKSEDISRFY